MEEKERKERKQKRKKKRRMQKGGKRRLGGSGGLGRRHEDDHNKTTIGLTMMMIMTLQSQNAIRMTMTTIIPSSLNNCTVCISARTRTIQSTLVPTGD